MGVCWGQFKEAVLRIFEELPLLRALLCVDRSALMPKASALESHGIHVDKNRFVSLSRLFCSGTG